MKLKNILLTLFFVVFATIAIKAPLEARHARWNVGFNVGGSAPCATRVYRPAPVYAPVYAPVGVPVYRTPIYAPAPVVVYPAMPCYEEVYVYPSQPVCRSFFGFGFSFGR